MVACWQVLAGGSEPAELRSALGLALPRAPGIEGQMVKEPAMLHTTIARLLLPPAGTTGEAGGREISQVFDTPAVLTAVQAMSGALVRVGAFYGARANGPMVGGDCVVYCSCLAVLRVVSAAQRTNKCCPLLPC